MSEFKISGVGYVSEWNGNAANAGTATSPKAHPNDAGMPGTFQDIIVIGTGYYKAPFPSGSLAKRWTADGRVIFDLAGLAIGAIPANPQVIWTGITFINGTINNQGAAYTMVNCNAINCPSIRFRSQSIFDGLLIVGDFNNPDTGSVGLRSCAFLGNQTGGNIINGNSPFTENFVDKNVRLFIGNYTNRNFFKNNMYNGLISILGVDYEFKLLRNGTTRPDATPGVLDIVSIWPDVYTTQKNFAGDPKWVDVLNRICEPDSDLLSASGIIGRIGNAKPGKSIPVISTDPNVFITTSQINTSNPVAWVIGAGFDEGFIDIVFKTGDNIAATPKFYLDALISMQASQPGGSASNNNVPDIFPTNYTPLSLAGLKPNRLTYQMRTSISATKPASDAQWDNDVATLGTDVRFYVQEWDTLPTISNVAGTTYGNGNPQTVGSIGNLINSRWVQIKIRLTNKRFI
jgi:hypothetical protein